MQVGAFVPLVVFATLMTGVGLRLLILWRRTHQTPELLLGSGIVLLAFVGLPLSALGRIPGAPGSVSGRLLFGSGMGVVGVSLFLLLCFTWRVFRPRARWARALVGAGAVVVLVMLGGVIHADSQGSTLAEILPRTRPWSLCYVGFVTLIFVWAAIESILYHGTLRKRLALGLADPVLVNRFLLWGVASAAMVAFCSFLIGCILSGMTIMRDPVPLRVMAVMGTIMSVTWYLTFFSPRAYRRFLNRRVEA